MEKKPTLYRIKTEHMPIIGGSIKQKIFSKENQKKVWELARFYESNGKLQKEVIPIEPLEPSEGQEFKEGDLLFVEMKKMWVKVEFLSNGHFI